MANDLIRFKMEAANWEVLSFWLTLLKLKLFLVSMASGAAGAGGDWDQLQPRRGLTT